MCGKRDRRAWTPHRVRCPGYRAGRPAACSNNQPPVDMMTPSLKIVEADLHDGAHQAAVVDLLDACNRDPMGDGKPLPAKVRKALIPGLQQHPTTIVSLAFTCAFGLLFGFFFIIGCAQVLIPGTLAGAGEYMRYTSTNVPKRTLMGSRRQVSAATHAALYKMNIRTFGRRPGGVLSPITATTAELLITISLEPVTPGTTRVTVDAARGQIVKDKATAVKILDQIQLELAADGPRDVDLSRIFVKNNCHGIIDVAVHYLDGVTAEDRWRSAGWFKLMPGEKKSTVATGGRYVYFYAVSPEDASGEWGGDFYQDLDGGRYGFFKVDLGTGTVDFTQSFNCED